jgi:hypothetical protein
MNQRAVNCFGISFDEMMLWDLPDTALFDVSDYKNPCKYLLYNDPFERMMDCHMDPATAAPRYTACADTLMAHTDHPAFGYVFETLGRLARILSVKADLGHRLYAAYTEKDRKTIEQIAYKDLPYILEELGLFLQAFRRQWYMENKTFGFTTQELRLGGLAERLRSVKARLEGYLEGSVERIEELEYAPLPLQPLPQETPYVNCNSWGRSSTASIL